MKAHCEIFMISISYWFENVTKQNDNSSQNSVTDEKYQMSVELFTITIYFIGYKTDGKRGVKAVI